MLEWVRAGEDPHLAVQRGVVGSLGCDQTPVDHPQCGELGRGAGVQEVVRIAGQLCAEDEVEGEHRDGQRAGHGEHDHREQASAEADGAKARPHGIE